ncbi:E1-E2 ATPase-domain-containing protein [Lipomyces oligophaga]|uniref:E1-E2 ATPase-domain-containing protein n=1 Tax=Lipomyces oligophaga TaxID=45792 RepID=UPI0034CE848B
MDNELVEGCCDLVSNDAPDELTDSCELDCCRGPDNIYNTTGDDACKDLDQDDCCRSTMEAEAKPIGDCCGTGTCADTVETSGLFCANQKESCTDNCCQNEVILNSGCCNDKSVDHYGDEAESDLKETELCQDGCCKRRDECLDNFEKAPENICCSAKQTVEDCCDRSITESKSDCGMECFDECGSDKASTFVKCCSGSSTSNITGDKHTILRFRPSKGKAAPKTCECDDECVGRLAKALCQMECESFSQDSCKHHQSVASHYSSFIQSKQEVLWRCICSVASQLGMSTCCASSESSGGSGNSYSFLYPPRTSCYSRKSRSRLTSRSTDSINKCAVKCNLDSSTKENYEAKVQNRKVESLRDVEAALETEKLTVSIRGMTCSSCESKAYLALQKSLGVSNVSVSYLYSRGTLEYNSSLTSPAKICAEVGHITGFKLAVLRSDESQFYCVSRRRPVGDQAGISALVGELWKIEYDPKVTSARQKIASLGLEVKDIIPNEEVREEGGNQILGFKIDQDVKSYLLQFLGALGLTIPILVLSWGSFDDSNSTVRSSIMLGLATCIQVICARKIYWSVFLTLRNGYSLDSDCLVALSTSISYLYSLAIFISHRLGELKDEDEIYEAPSLLISLVLFGKLISTVIRLVASRQLSFTSYQPTKFLLAGSSENYISSSLLQYDDEVVLNRGERAVTDGIITSGFAEFDESHITGESLPVYKKKGNEVLAGAEMISESQVIFRVTRLVPENSVSNVKVLVNSVSSFRMRQSGLVEKVATLLIPIMIGVTCLVFVIWMLVDTQGTRKWSSSKAAAHAITFAIATLAVSCPCALVLAIPLVLSAGVAVGKEEYGILLKSAIPVDNAHRIKHVVFDKTGTLTSDKLEVNYAWFNESTDLPVRNLVELVVLGNHHPISRAVASYLTKFNQDVRREVVELGEIEQVIGSGMITTISSPTTEKQVTLVCGKPSFVGIAQHDQRIKSVLSKGSSLFCAGVRGGPILAIFGITSTIRANSSQVIEALKHRGLKVHVLSGDSSAAVSTVCSMLGITDFLAEASPEDKLHYVTSVKEDSAGVLFCGDGANDSIALAEADIGLAMTSEGITLAAADSCILNGDIAGVLRLFDVSRQIYIRIILAIVWALVYNFFAVLVASGAFVSFTIGPAWSGVSELISLAPVVGIALSTKLARP